ncbi:D-mannonate oxidoreductase [Bradyrhizobium sp. LTSP885]|uniref:mannitol dehydrogenase family protein n=1 Tax=Bradyrhizobium sp. LTSP885 TaxID=1619232 RepID=UPI0005C8E5EF|nr:mannitol dehydrogenase family protein [Bradyrhizobium sp. LTSP885]KJC41030.1 D-mannonate oxidoreductase [Bradyrhizobium sp. LTSP885]
MNAPKRLSSLADVTGAARRPTYDPARHGHGIVHLGIGAFHRAHQAAYTDAALAAGGGDWRIVGASLRSVELADALNPQNGLYTLIERGASEVRARVIGSIAHVIAASRAPADLMTSLIDRRTRIVTMTVTEKAYGVDRATMTVDLSHPVVAADLQSPDNPSGVLGLLTEALRRRRIEHVDPFTVLCCDNLPDNGGFVRCGMIDFARRRDPALGDWIAEKVSFPSCMVDRITPASTEQTREDALRLTGCIDQAPVETEPFAQWVIDDRFPTGRPAWEAGGALFVDDVEPYEAMKLRMLNGAHSMLAYAGFLSGRRYVRDTAGPAGFCPLIERHFKAAAATLPRLPAIDLDAYARQLLSRFANPAIAHETYQIAMDGTEKLPQRILAPALEARAKGLDVRPFAFAIAAWMRYCHGRLDDGTRYVLRDPREDEIGRLLSDVVAPSDVVDALHALPNFFPAPLRTDPVWRNAVNSCLGTMMGEGMQAALAAEMRT